MDQNPEKIKELTDHEEIEKMVDEYMQNEFEGVIGGGVKTKFKVTMMRHSTSTSSLRVMVSATNRSFSGTTNNSTATCQSRRSPPTRNKP